MSLAMYTTKVLQDAWALSVSSAFSRWGFQFFYVNRSCLVVALTSAALISAFSVNLIVFFHVFLLSSHVHEV